MRVAAPITLSDAEKRILRRWLSDDRYSERQTERARIVLLAASGKSNKEIAEDLGKKPHTVGRWRKRFAESGLAGIAKELPRGGRPRRRREAIEREILRKTFHDEPTRGTRWSTRMLAQELGISRSMVQRVWKDHGVRPHVNGEDAPPGDVLPVLAWCDGEAAEDWPVRRLQRRR